MERMDSEMIGIVNPDLMWEVLNAVFVRTSFCAPCYHAFDGTNSPIFKRDYEMSYLRFGTLVDVLNSPEKYEKHHNSLQQFNPNLDEINATKYRYFDVAHAIEILSLNGHVKDVLIFNDKKQIKERRIQLTPKGEIAYHESFYGNQVREITQRNLQNQSVINTNNSVRETNKIQKRLGWLTGFLGLLSAVFIGYSTYFQYSSAGDGDKNREELKSLKTELNMIQQTLQQIETHLPSTQTLPTDKAVLSSSKHSKTNSLSHKQN